MQLSIANVDGMRNEKKNYEQLRCEIQSGLYLLVCNTYGTTRR